MATSSKSVESEELQIKQQNRKANIQWIVIALLGIIGLVALVIFFGDTSSVPTQHSPQ